MTRQSGAEEQSRSRRRLLRATVGGAALVGAGLAAAADAQPAMAQAGEPLVGSWLMRVSGNTDPGERELTSFQADGVVVATNTPIHVSSLEPGRLDGYSTPGHGAWVRTGERQYRATVVFVEVNPDGAFQFTTTLTMRLTLSPDGRSFSGTVMGVIRDTSDEVIFTSAEDANTVAGVRITA